MIVYIDSEYCCHAEPAADRRPIEDGFFEGKCKAFIEGWRYVPVGETWTDKDGNIFIGSVFPVATYAGPAAAQAQYEADMAASADMVEALEILGVTE